MDYLRTVSSLQFCGRTPITGLFPYPYHIISISRVFKVNDIFTGIPFSVIATKADKISRGARMKYLAPICRALSVQPWEILCFSGEDGTGREELLKLLEQVLKA